MPDWVMEKMTCLLGCEVCQDVCPLNRFIRPRPVSSAEAEAFDLGKLIAGDIKPALALVGKNMKKGGKLTAQAAVLAANRNRTDLLPLLEEQAAQTDGPLKDTLLWAISHLKNAD
jgi:epoxyqueuosine reductase QueG